MAAINSNPADPKSRTATEHQMQEELSPRLSAVARSAIVRTEDCLSGLTDRVDDAEYDRGARSAESLMRVAKAAVSLREQIERHAATDGAGQPSQNPIADEDIDAIVREFDAAVRRLDTKTKDASAALPEGVDQ